MKMSHTRRAFIRSNGESKVEEVGRVGEVGDHSRGQVEFSQVLQYDPSVKSQAAADEIKANLSVPGFVRRLSWASSSQPPPRSSSCSISVSRRYVSDLSDTAHNNMKPALIMACNEYKIGDVSQGQGAASACSPIPYTFRSRIFVRKPYSKLL